MIIAMLFDPNGVGFSDQEEEYSETEEMIRGAYPDWAITFKRDFYPSEWMQGRYDALIVDYGGACLGARDTAYSIMREFVKVAEARPSTLFIVWSSWTEDLYWEAVRRELDHVVLPNVLMGGTCVVEIGAWIKLNGSTK